MSKEIIYKVKQKLARDKFTEEGTKLLNEAWKKYFSKFEKVMDKINKLEMTKKNMPFQGEGIKPYEKVIDSIKSLKNDLVIMEEEMETFEKKLKKEHLIPPVPKSAYNEEEEVKKLGEIFYKHLVRAMTATGVETGEEGDPHVHALAFAVAKSLKEFYGTHNFSEFKKSLNKYLK